jgi:hypothetical protein
VHGEAMKVHDALMLLATVLLGAVSGSAPAALL